MIRTMNTLSLFVLVFTFSYSAKAEFIERERLLQQEDPASLTPQRLSNDSEVYLFSDSLLRDADEDLGILKDYYFTGNDKSRISFSVHLSSDYSDPGKVSTLQGQYLSKFNDYKQLWWGLQIKRTSAKYSALADEIESTTGHTDSDSLITRGDETQSMTTLGIGIGQRFRMFGDFIESNKVFETAMIFVNAVSHLDSATSTTYQGYGFTAEYGVHYRSNESFFYGGKFAYNLASVVREAKSDEKQEDRSLVFGWPSLAFEFGYYY